MPGREIESEMVIRRCGALFPQKSPIFPQKRQRQRKRKKISDKICEAERNKRKAKKILVFFHKKKLVHFSFLGVSASQESASEGRRGESERECERKR